MANTLTGLIPTVYSALDTVSRELVGFIPAVRRNTGIERASKGQTITFPIVPQGATEDITPGQHPANSGSQTIGTGTMTISKSKAYPILWNGEESNSLNAGADVNQIPDPILQNQFAQAFRTLANEIEADIWATYVASSRAVGTAGTLPFGTADDFSDFASIIREMNANGAPSADLHLILGNASAANLRAKQSSLFKANEAGSTDLLRRGFIGTVQGLMVGESNQVAAHTKGTGSGYLQGVGSTLPVGSTDIILDTGTGTVLAGDVVTFAGDTNKYVVTTGVAAPGTITIAEPGLLQTLADNVALTVGASTNETNIAFDRSAIVLAARLPMMPSGGDSADDRQVVVDPVSGLAFDVAIYRQYHQIKYEVSIAWGVSMVKPAHAINLLG